jgi:hypothetical protein
MSIPDDDGTSAEGGVVKRGDGKSAEGGAVKRGNVPRS